MARAIKFPTRKPANTPKPVVRRCDCGRRASVNLVTYVYLSGKALHKEQGLVNARTYLTENSRLRIALPLCRACQTLEILACREHHQPLPRFEPL